jgi:hypothetical protein
MRTVQEKIDAYKGLLAKKKSWETEVSSANALIEDKKRLLGKKMQEATTKFGAESYDDLVAKQAEKTAEIDAILKRAEDEGLIQ